MVATSDFSGLVSSPWALARAAAIAPMVSLERCMAGLRLQRSKLIAPDLERLARRPCPNASLASSGTSFLSSALAPSCS